MNKSPEINHIAAALVRAQAAMKPALKDGTNPHFKSSYATLQSVWDAAREVLTPNGLTVVQTFGPSEGETLNITTTLMHTSGQWIAGTMTLKPTKADPQGIGSAATYGRRYGLAAILGIVADEDDDGNHASEPAKKQPYKPNGPLAKADTVKALQALCGDAKTSTKLQTAMDARNVLTFDELSEEDAQKLLKWATK